MKSIRVDKQAVDTYTDEELHTLLRKPDTKTCHYVEYQCWVMTNLLFSTGIRQRSMMNLTVRDVDLANQMLNVRVTKNRKPLLIPLNATMCDILREYFVHREAKSDDDLLFTNVYGQPLVRSTCYGMLYAYNKGRGVATTGIHRYRHTFAKQWILGGGNVVALSRMLGHSNLSITQNYVNLLVSDLAKQVEEVNLLDRFAGKRQRKL
jgi:integrase/recombinase XerD